MKPLERLLRASRVRALSLDDAAAFAADRTGGARVLFLPGDLARPEVTDLAVVVAELLELYPKIEVAVGVDAGEQAMRDRFGVTSFPTLVLTSHGEVVKRIARMQPWSTYDALVRGLGEREEEHHEQRG